MRQIDREAFAQIYEAHFKRVYNYICYRINNHADTEDLVSQVFARVIERYDRYDPQKAVLEAWIIGIAKNAVNDYFRKKMRRADVNLAEVEGTLSFGEEPEGITVKKERNRLLMEALNTLTDRERNVVALKYGAGLSNKQIAQTMELSESNTGVILFRSLDKLRRYMEKEESACEKTMWRKKVWTN